jgi:hypothetical protein
MKKQNKQFIKKAHLPEKIKEVHDRVSILGEQIKIFKKKPAAVKENMDVISIKNLDTGKVSQAFVLTNAKDGKSQLLYIDNNKPVGKKSSH